MDGSSGPRRSQRLASKSVQQKQQQPRQQPRGGQQREASLEATAPPPAAAPHRRARAKRGAAAAQASSDSTPTSSRQPLPRMRANAAAGAAAVVNRPGSLQRPAKRPRAEPPVPGFWERLPLEVTDSIVGLCTPRQLALLETSCRFWSTKVDVEAICERRLKDISRAKGLEPNKTAGEKWSSLLHFINAQSCAAAQATALAFGGYHSSALLVEVDASGYRDHPHSLYTWGRGFHGQLGHNEHVDEVAPKTLCLGYAPCMDLANMEEEITAAVVACGTDHTATISRRGQLFTWGLGNSGELGHEDGPTYIDTPFPRRAYLWQAETVRIVSVACGGSHTLAIAENGTLWSCGRNKSGQLGVGSTADSHFLVRVVNLPRQARIVSAGAGALHSMALASDGSLFTWGDARYGQLGHSHLHQPHIPNHNPIQRFPLKVNTLNPTSLLPFNRVTAISCGTWHGMAVTVGGGLLAFGRNNHGQLGTGTLVDQWRPTDVSLAWTGEHTRYFRAAQVACGAMHSMVLVAHRGRLTACSTGYNYFGQLGIGSTTDALQFGPVRSVRDPVALIAGEHNSGCIGGDGRVWLWGRNDWGQLGLGDDVSRNRPTQLQGFKAVHPDRTLRKSKRSAPRLRPIAPSPSSKAEDEETAPIVTAWTKAGGECRPGSGEVRSSSAAHTSAEQPLQQEQQQQPATAE